MNSKKKYYILFNIYLLLSSLLFPSTRQYYNVVDYGAKADGKILNTKSIQEAIDKCASNGGGTVVFPAGTYLSGTIVMKDNVILHLEAGSKILGSKNIDDYRVNLKLISNNKQKDINGALILALDKKNIGITGFGTIDGQGKSFYGKENRPVLLFFNGCKDVTIKGVTLQHPASWTQHYLKCNGVTIRDVKVFAHGGENNDMVDINQSRNVVITGLNGDSDDDGITLKSTAEGLVENVIISDCNIRTRTNAIKMGTESYGGFRDITITNCTISPSVTETGFSGAAEGLAGIALEIVDGGIMENITVSNIVIEETTSPIFIRLGNRARNYPKLGLESKPIGSINNIKISNIIARNASKTGCSIVGEIGHPITNVSISNVKINFKGGGTLKEGLSEKPELVNEYPESTQLGILPAYGFFVRHVDGITFRDVEFTYDEEEHRPAMLFNDVKNLKLLNFDAETADDALGQIVLQNSENVFVNGCSPKASNVFLNIERNSKNVSLVANNLIDVKNPIVLDKSIKTEDLHIISNLRDNLKGESTLFEFLQPNIKRDSLGMVSIYFPFNAEIYYSTDGSEPTKRSKKYVQPFEQISPADIKAAAFDNNKISSIAALKTERVQVIAPQILPANQYFYKSIRVKLFSNTKGADIYYTLDGSKPIESSQKYDGNLEINKSVTLKVKAIKNGYTPSDETVSYYQTIKKEEGVQYKYYETNIKNKWEKLPNFLKLTPAREGLTDKFSLADIKTSETYFGLVMNGFITITQEGEYTFYLGSNDGSKLIIDNKEIVNNDGIHGYIEKSGKIYLGKGEHLIEVRYYQAGGSKHLNVFWDEPGIEKQEIIPN
ncbi:Polygalacturonase [hydrothermal vent metagenome]|uniref:Polygalacturonase n=1 Tax=hydrothermal vent metagenome TaxID=652676 RepID=A0A3B1CD99_9ZZZZ